MGVKPGPEFDRIIAKIFALQLDGKIKSHPQLMKEMRELAGIKEPPPPPAPPPPKKGKETPPSPPADHPQKGQGISSTYPASQHQVSQGGARRASLTARQSASLILA